MVYRKPESTLPGMMPLQRNVISRFNQPSRPVVTAASMLQQPLTSTSQISDAQNMYASQGLQAGALRAAQPAQSTADLLRSYGLGMPTAPQAAATPAPLRTARPATGLSGMLPAAGTPEMAGLGAAGRTLMQLGGYQKEPMTLGQILGIGTEAGLKTMRERQSEIAAAKRQAEQDALTKRYREAQIKQMGKEKESDVKKPYSVPAVRDGVRGTVQKQYLGRGALGADKYGLVEVPNSFVPDPEKAPAVQIQPEDKAAAARAQTVSKYVTDFLSNYDKDVMNARQLISEYGVIQDMLTSAEDVDTGPLTEMILPLQRVLGELGFLNESEMNKVNTLTTLDAKMKYIVPRMREEGSGSTSNFEMGVFKSAAPGLAKTREANILLAAMAKQAAQHKINVQDTRRKLALGDGTQPLYVPSDKEVGEAVEAEYGSIFKTPFGREINKKDFAEVDAEFDSMIADGRVNIGDVVYLGKHYKGADGKIKNGGFYVVSAEDI